MKIELKSPDIYFISPLPLGECRRRLLSLQTNKDSASHYFRAHFYPRDENGLPFKLVSHTFNYKTSQWQDSVKFRGFFKKRDGQSTYVTLYPTLDQLFLTKVLVGIVALSLCLVGIVALTTEKRADITICAAMLFFICSFFFWGAWSEINFINQIKLMLEEPHGRAVFQKEKHKRNLEHFPIYDKSYYFEIEE